MKNKPRLARKTIGVLVDRTVDPFQQVFLNGIMDCAVEKGASCIIFEGGGVGSPYEYETQRNIIYRLASDAVVDGLVILSDSAMDSSGEKQTKSYAERFRSLPIVGVSVAIPNAISVLADNRPGMRELLVHLIGRHGFRRFGFIKGRIGNPDAVDRFEVFREVMKEHHFPLDPRFIFQGDFTIDSGVEAARAVIQKGVSNIDVLVASNDNMAMGAMEEFSRRGIPIPSRIAVTGFDNVDHGNSLSVPLTTVRMPIYEEGWTAASLLLDTLDHKNVPARVSIPTKLIVRESCRCLSGAPIVKKNRTKNQSITIPPKRSEGEAVFQTIRDITDSLLQGRTDLNPEAVSRRLYQSYRKAATHEFLAVFQEAVSNPLSYTIDYFSFRNMLEELWKKRSGKTHEHAAAAAENLYFQALLQMGQKIMEREAGRINTLVQENQKLEVIRELMFTLNLSRQMDVLAHRIPEMGIKSCFVSLYTTDPTADNGISECILGIRNKKRTLLGVKEKSFSTKNLVPNGFLSDRRQHLVIVEAMKQFGFIVFETDRKSNRFFAYLSDIISGAVQGSILYKELEDQKNDLDHSLDRIRKAMSGFIQTMAATVETRDPYTAGHQRRVSDLARTIAQEMGLSATQVDCVRMAGIVHDLGKIYIPAEILNRAGILDDVEWSMIKKHPKVAWDILKNIDFPWPLAEIVRQHHERLNGKGYPSGLKGKAISLEARILAVADVVEAMSSHRPYREALGIERALAEINKHKRTLYDPTVVDICTKLFREKGYIFKPT